MRRAARGFSLIEIIVAMTILAITLAGFAGLTFQYLRRVRTLDSRVAMFSLMGEQAQRLTVLPWDSLSSRAGCTTVTTGVLPHTTCVVLTDVNTARKLVRVVITPANTAIRPDTVQFHRVKPFYDALCQGC
jgi:prepilin-type N-terminal cleavage/methylation domain-containing protein